MTRENPEISASFLRHHLESSFVTAKAFWLAVFVTAGIAASGQTDEIQKTAATFIEKTSIEYDQRQGSAR